MCEHLLESRTVLSKAENFEEDQYLNLIREILSRGTWEEGRNGRTKSIFGHSMRFSLANGKIPILTTKKTAWNTCLKELLWFISGKTSNQLLLDQGVRIWDGNSSREFLDSRGLFNYEEDELGPIYGRQWRQFNKPFFCKKDQQTYNDGKTLNNLRKECITTYSLLLNDLKTQGVDQLQEIIDQIKNPKTRTSRRFNKTSNNLNWR